MTLEEQQAKEALDSIIKKSRVHLYKPIQIAEILYHDRCIKQLDFLNLDTYRNQSKLWRDEICRQFLGRISTSSAKFQDNLFDKNAMPPEKLMVLGTLNRQSDGGVESYIYKQFFNRFSQMSEALAYVGNTDRYSFQLSEFLNLFWLEPGLKRSIDKIYEIVVYALFDALVSELGITVSIDFPKENLFLWKEYQDFAEKIISIPKNGHLELPAKIHRVGVTNAADRGLDMWSNFGLAIQVKHLSLDEELAEDIVSSISADRIVIVCKKAEQSVIVSLLTQIGWKSRIQNIVTEDDLIRWYEKALRGQYPIAEALLENIKTEIMREFPAINEANEFLDFIKNREYDIAVTNNMTTIYNTLTRQKEPFTPIDPKNVRMYVCGMTVYDYCHLGHARVMVVFDMIARWLRECGYPLTYVRNITDIDDKIIARAAENGETIGELTARFIQAMHEDADALGVLRPDIEPKATENIPQMIAMIETLIQNGKAYPAANGDVYYAVREFSAYGQLSGKSLDDLRAGERVEVDGFKRDPLDFVLWKAAKAGEPAWESPWGNGRPGWHIECSAMSENLFGDTFDIHGGGADLQFPHHENEIAQSVGATGHTCGHDHAQTHHGQSIASHVKYWLHNGFIRVDGEKMSKSLGNFFTIREVLKQYDPEVVRFFILRAHYRSPLNYSDAHLDDAKGALTRLYTTLKNTPAVAFELSENANDYTRRFYAAMNDDFGTVEAVAVLFELAGEVNKTNDAHLAGCLKALGGIIGLLQRDPTEFLQGGAVSDGLSNEEIDDLIARRKQARADKNWAESDRIRDLLNEHKIILEDNAGGTTWRRG